MSVSVVALVSELLCRLRSVDHDFGLGRSRGQNFGLGLVLVSSWSRRFGFGLQAERFVSVSRSELWSRTRAQGQNVGFGRSLDLGGLASIRRVS